MDIIKIIIIKKKKKEENKKKNMVNKVNLSKFFMYIYIYKKIFNNNKNDIF